MFFTGFGKKMLIKNIVKLINVVGENLKLLTNNS